MRNRYVFLADIAAIGVAMLGAFVLRFDWRFFEYRPEFSAFLAAAFLVKPAIFHRFGLYRRYWRYATVRDLSAVVFACGATAVAMSLFIGIAVPLGLIQEFSRAVLVSRHPSDLAGRRRHPDVGSPCPRAAGRAAYRGLDTPSSRRGFAQVRSLRRRSGKSMRGLNRQHTRISRGSPRSWRQREMFGTRRRRWNRPRRKEIGFRSRPPCAIGFLRSPRGSPVCRPGWAGIRTKASELRPSAARPQVPTNGACHLQRRRVRAPGCASPVTDSGADCLIAAAAVGLVDQVSFALMCRPQLDTAFAFAGTSRSKASRCLHRRRLTLVVAGHPDRPVPVTFVRARTDRAVSESLRHMTQSLDSSDPPSAVELRLALSVATPASRESLGRQWVNARLW